MISENIFHNWDLSLLGRPKGEMPEHIYKESINPKPVRKLNKKGRSVTALIPDAKHNQMLAAESRGWELSFAYRAIMDPKVKIRTSQPYQFRVPRPDINGRVTTCPYTPDYFIELDTGELIYVECKTEEQLEKKSHRYQHLDSGVWTDPAVQEYVNDIGAYYMIWTDSHIGPEMHRNIALLSPHKCKLGGRVIKEEKEICSYIAEQSEPRSIGTILKNFDNEGNEDRYRSALYNLIAAFHVFVRIDIQKILDEDYCLVFAERNTSTLWNFEHPNCPALIKQIRVEVGESYELNGKRLEVIGIDAETAEYCVNMEGKYVKIPFLTLKEDLFKGAAIKAECAPLNELLNRFNIFPTSEKRRRAERRLAEFIKHKAGEIKLPDSTQKRYSNGYAFGLKNFGQPLWGLMDKGRAGNHGDGHSDSDRDFLVRYVRQSFLRVDPKDDDIPTCPYAHSRIVIKAHAHYTKHAKIRKYASYGIKRFRKEVNRVSDEAKERSLKGHKAANRAAAPLWPSSKFPHKAYYPGDIAEIDSTVGDTYLLGALGQELGKVTISAMIDQFSRKCTAIEYTTEGASRALLMKLVRKHVENYEYLPRVILVDHGSEYDSDYCRMMCYRLDIELRSRPAGDARFGGFVETFNRAMNVDCLHNTNGSTRLMLNPRDLSPGFRPEDLTTWTLERFDKEIETYRNFYGQTVHSEIKGFTPNQFFEAGRERLTLEEKRIRKFDESFLELTRIDVDQGGTRLAEGGVVRHLGRLYESEELKLIAEKGLSYPTRYDPDDFSKLYVDTPQGTVEAKVKDAVQLETLTHAQVKRMSVLAQREDLKSAYQKKRTAQVVEYGEHLVAIEAEDKKLLRYSEEQKIRRNKKGKSEDFEDHYTFEIPDDDDDIKFG